MKAGSSGGVEGIKGPDAATGLSQVCTESGIRCPSHVASLLTYYAWASCRWQPAEQ
jgi:hypothetical protein